MQDFNVKNKKWWIAVIFCIWPFIYGCIFCALQGSNIFEIYLPGGWISDEVSYYKQMEAMLDYGMPQGNWGYNESFAKNLTFGGWVNVSYWPYLLLGKVLGWSFATPVICNIFFLTLGFFMFYLLVKPDVRQMVTILLLYSLAAYLERYVLSGMLEPLVMAMMIVTYALYINIARKKSVWKLVILYLLISYMVFFRPYFAVLFLVPCFLAGEKKWKYSVPISVILAVSTVMGYEYLAKNYCSPYIPATGISQHSGIMTGSVYQLLKSVWHMIKNGTCGIVEQIKNGGCTYASGYVVLMILSVLLFCNLISMLKDKDNNIYLIEWNIVVIFFYVSVLAAVILLYDAQAGSRHAMQISILGLFTLGMYFNKCQIKWTAATLVLLSGVLLIYFPGNNYPYHVPIKSDVMVDNSELQQQLEDNLIQSEGITWENCIAFAAQEVDYNLAYFLPAWSGVQIVWNGYFVQTGIENMKSKYLLVGIESATAELCEQSGAKVVFTSEENGFIIYENPRYENGMN